MTENSALHALTTIFPQKQFLVLLAWEFMPATENHCGNSSKREHLFPLCYMRGVRFPLFCLLGCPHHKADCFVHIIPKWILHVAVSPFPRMPLFSGVCLCPSKHSFLMPFPFRATTALFAVQASFPALSRPTSIPFFLIRFTFYAEDEGSRLFKNDGTDLPNYMVLHPLEL